MHVSVLQYVWDMWTPMAEVQQKIKGHLVG